MSVPWEIEVTNSGWRTIKGSPPPIDHAAVTRIQKFLDTSGPIETFAAQQQSHLVIPCSVGEAA